VGEYLCDVIAKLMRLEARLRPRRVIGERVWGAGVGVSGSTIGIAIGLCDKGGGKNGDRMFPCRKIVTEWSKNGDRDGDRDGDGYILNCMGVSEILQQS
jgi:hypothetical protein